MYVPCIMMKDDFYRLETDGVAVTNDKAPNLDQVIIEELLLAVEVLGVREDLTLGEKSYWIEHLCSRHCDNYNGIYGSFCGVNPLIFKKKTAQIIRSSIER